MTDSQSMVSEVQTFGISAWSNILTRVCSVSVVIIDVREIVDVANASISVNQNQRHQVFDQ